MKEILFQNCLHVVLTTASSVFVLYISAAINTLGSKRLLLLLPAKREASFE